MILWKLFEDYGYYNIINQADALSYKLSVGIFYDDGQIPKELKYLYISRTCDELFLILDGRNQNIKELCKKWDQKISIFIAFGSEEQNITERIKYNVIQIILCEDNIDDRSEEGSLNISRKILLPYMTTEEGDIIIPDTEIVEIPFYIVPAGDFKVNQQILNALKAHIPDSSADDLVFLEKPLKKVSRKKGNDNKIAKSLSEDQYIKIKGWLNSYDYSDN